jgi:hypothetical protein
MTTRHRPITQDEESKTPRAILAASLGFLTPLTIEQAELVCDDGLATLSDLVEVEADAWGRPVATGYGYVGDAWEVDYHHGRPILVERGTAATGYVADVERQFAWALHLVGGPDHGPRTDEEIAEIRSDAGWARSFAAAEAADRRMVELRRRGGPELELAAERLARAREVASHLGVDPSSMWSDPLRIGDESATARYTVVVGRDGRSSDPDHVISFHGDATAAVEGVLALTVVGGWRLVTVHDLDRSDWEEPLVLQALVTIEGDPQVAVRRVVPCTAFEGVST